MRSEYYLPEDPLRAKVSFKPDPTRDVVLRFNYNGTTGTTKETTLFPVPYTYQTAEQSLQNAQFGEDIFLVSTDSGEFAYCPQPEQQKRLEFLEENRELILETATRHGINSVVARLTANGEVQETAAAEEPVGVDQMSVATAKELFDIQSKTSGVKILWY
ncbi:MAG: hypothetical protein II230_05555, partial [Clostridia bacterium]|nr:hypothetical protein [Clostridia bacterium]